MKIYAIGDLHLPGGDDKPMEVFGSHWEGHWQKIKEDWLSKVGDEDVVLIPGDISWAMQLEHAVEDLRAIGALPGRKIILRGNHDYWWGSITRVREALPEGMYALQNDAIEMDGVVFCGSRGWTIPTGEDGETARIYARELLRMRMSLERAAKQANGKPLIFMTHFPPLGEGGVTTAVSDMLEEFSVRDAVYGHLHGASVKTAFTGEVNGVNYHFVSCDGLEFKLHRVW